MNAKILLELPGVEAGSKECGKCKHRYFSGWPDFITDCLKFGDMLTPAERALPFAHNVLRCPACLAAEEEANTIGAEEGEVMNPKVELWSVITRGKKNRVVEVHATQKNALMDMVPGDNPEPEPVSVVRDGGKLAKKEG